MDELSQLWTLARKIFSGLTHAGLSCVDRFKAIYVESEYIGKLLKPFSRSCNGGLILIVIMTTMLQMNAKRATGIDRYRGNDSPGPQNLTPGAIIGEPRRNYRPLVVTEYGSFRLDWAGAGCVCVHIGFWVIRRLWTMILPIENRKDNNCSIVGILYKKGKSCPFLSTHNHLIITSSHQHSISNSHLYPITFRTFFFNYSHQLNMRFSIIALIAPLLLAGRLVQPSRSRNPSSC